jgi:dihydrofolate synthase / folylpolyglutamate synthase
VNGTHGTHGNGPAEKNGHVEGPGPAGGHGEEDEVLNRPDHDLLTGPLTEDDPQDPDDPATAPRPTGRDAPDATDPALAARFAGVVAAIRARTPEQVVEPSLDRIADLCTFLGDPQHSWRTVHVTGTNGKSSTTRMVEALLREHGLRTGLFTSPDLGDLRDRIAVDGERLDRERFADAYAEILPYVRMVDERAAAAGQPPLSFFELLVALAYAAFADAPVQVAAIEVGMGGGWDATNVANGDVAVVTPVALDHQEYLGGNLVDIAAEKAGIVKEGSTLVTARQTPVVEEILLSRAREVGARVLREDVDFGVVSRDQAVGGQLLTLHGPHGPIDEIFLPLHGEHQARNAACALVAAENLLTEGQSPLDPQTVREAFATVVSPGRLETVRVRPTVLVDAAHNPAGAEALAAAVRESFAFTRLVGVVAVFGDKDAEGILSELEPVLNEIVVTSTFSPRCLDPQDLGALAEEVFGQERVHIAPDFVQALDLALGRAEEGGLIGGGVLVTGSVSAAGQARRLLLRR